jgi:hypothetical protein
VFVYSSSVFGAGRATESRRKNSSTCWGVIKLLPLMRHSGKFAGAQRKQIYPESMNRSSQKNGPWIPGSRDARPGMTIIC